MTSSPREVWDWWSRGKEVGGGRRRAEAGLSALKGTEPIGHPVQRRAAARLAGLLLRNRCPLPAPVAAILQYPSRYFLALGVPGWGGSGGDYFTFTHPKRRQ